MRLLSRRALTERELRTKLGAAGYAYPEIRETVAECRRRGFVNDEQFAADYTEILAARGLGGRRIQLALGKRGIPRQLQTRPLEEAAEGEAQRAREALEYKLRLLSRETDPRKKREKAFRFLISRGFSCDSCRAALDEIDFNH